MEEHQNEAVRNDDDNDWGNPPLLTTISIAQNALLLSILLANIDPKIDHMANPNPAALVNQPPPTVTRKSITGFVTKLVGDGATYGFINDEIFFQQTNVTDGPAGVNDRVFAECEYSAHLPIKWNATSIKIVARASSSAGPSGATGHQGPANILESDPRRQSRQGMLLTQQQQQQQQMALPLQQQPQFSSPNQQQQQQNVAPVANTYQQHRQQKQQQQHLLPNQQELLQQPIGGQIDAGMNQGPEFFSPFGQAPPPIAQHPGEMPPFDTPMGPPKLEYTSQLGSAFIQNQYMSGPILPQQAPAPLLPQVRPQQQQSQQQRPQQQAPLQNRRDQQRNLHSKDGFNNDKNDRNNLNNRGRNRKDNKFEQTRGGSERENSNSRSSRAGSDSRDRSNSRNDSLNKCDRDSSKREGIVKRPSPAGNSARSTNNLDRGNKTSKRLYDPQNIPRTTILSNMNAWNMRSRCPSSIHVPSDLKNIIVNPYIRLDVKNLPKPLNYKIEPTEDAQDGNGCKEPENDATKKDADASEKGEESKPSSASDTNDESQQSNATRKDTDITPPSSKSDPKLTHKYGVKVVLISLPELEAIHKKVFGDELDSYNKECKAHPRLDEAISLLCNTGSNGGHSLIGGKFDSTVDGFVEGETNEFERFGRQPDLIATCRRVVSEQTGLDLGPCQGWTLVSTFIYNNKTDYFSPKASIEYSFIYMPHIWSMTTTDLDESPIEKESLAVNVSSLPQSNESRDVSMTEENEIKTSQDEEAPEANAEETSAESQVTLENLSVLKVADLKAELDKRVVAYKPNAKKAELAAALGASIAEENSGHQPEVVPSLTEESGQKGSATDGQYQLEEGEVVASGATTPTDDMEGVSDELDKETLSEPVSGKRKAEDECDNKDGNEIDGPQESKRLRETKDNGRVELIKEPFVVKALKGQQLSVVTLYDVAQVSRYDQFELSVASNILKEALIQHLSEYMFTALVEESRQRATTAAQSGDNNSLSSSTNSQETNSDSNNNSKPLSSKNTQQQQQTTTATSTTDGNAPAAMLKEYPVDRYINLAFAYFDHTHLGYLHADDLSKLFCNTGLTISKRALMSLVNESEKFNYLTLADLSPKLAPLYVYKFPDQFTRLPGASATGDASETGQTGKMIEYQGVRYDVEKLVQQAREAETSRVTMAERFNHAIENFDKQADEIHVLEVSRMSLSKSIKSLNEELDELKRERDLADKKFENLKTKLDEMLAELQRDK